LRIKIGNELLLLNLLVIVLIAAIVFSPSNILRIILGLPFVLFFPGYALVAALFPKREGISGIERVALSLGVSIAIVPLIGLALNYTPWGIGLESLLYSIASFIFIFSIVAWVRRKGLWAGDRFNIEFQVGMGGGARGWALSIILGLAILGALGMAGYAIAMPKVGQSFSEFYVLGQDGKSITYPIEVKTGEEGRVIVGITNHEYKTMSYQIEVRINGVSYSEVGPIVLEHDENWQEEVGFVPGAAGDNQRLELVLYKNGEDKPSLEPLRLRLDVKQ
jgi:uncharacterized membrane protein